MVGICVWGRCWMCDLIWVNCCFLGRMGVGLIVGEFGLRF